MASGGTGVTTSTGSGNNVLSTSPTLVTPILGTPTSGNLVNCTGFGYALGSMVRVHQATSGTALSFDTKDFDTLSEYNTSTKTFTATSAGYYAVEMTIQQNVSNGSYSGTYSINTNGTG